MSANFVTDQLAAEVAARRGADPLGMAQARIARDLADYLARILPDLDSEAIGAVMLHASSCLGGLLSETARRQGRPIERSALLTVNLLAIAGGWVYTGRSPR
jgi:hypothetical protein